MAEVQSLDAYMKTLASRAFVDLYKKKPIDIVNRLDKMYKLGVDLERRMKYGDAYIYFRRWMNCVEWLQKQSINPTVQKHYPNDKIKKVKDYLIKLSSLIKREYEAKQESLTAQLNNSKTNDDIVLGLPDIPKDEPQPKGETEINNKLKFDQITCTQLFEMLTNGTKHNSKKVLIIDTRNSEEYNKLRISFQDSIINIPGNKFDPKTSLSFNYCLLITNTETKDLINSKVSNTTEYIVLLDSNSSAETIDNNSRLSLFKNLFSEKFELNSKNSKIVILKGGFEEWVETYPTYVTKSIEEDIPEILNNMSNDILDNIHYCPQDSYTSSHISGLSNKSSVNNKFYQPTNSQILDVSNSIPNNSSYVPPNLKIFSNVCQPQVTLEPLTDSQLMLNNRNLPLYNNVTTPTEIPSFIPPTSINGAYSYENGTINTQSLLNNMKEPVLILEKVDQIPKKPLVDRSNKPGNKKPNQEITNLKKDLALVREQINSMRSNFNTQDDWMREDLECLLKREQELITKLESLSKPQTAPAKSNSIYPDLSSKISVIELESRKKAPAAQIPKPTFSEEKENIIKPQESIERFNVEPSAPQNMDVDEEEVYKAPLKRECNTPINSRMKRSYSSPNLQDMEKEGRRIIPEVDRSSKPRLESAKGTKQWLAIPAKDRMLHLNPVASSACHPGITGLKNLGNSCYMNSIIQCLSNTECLANYFNDNTYTHDLKCEKNYTCVAEEVAHVIKALWRGTYKSISPFDLKVVVGHYKLQFKNHEQQDSHEFLTFLLEWMHNDLKKKSKITYNRPLTTIEAEWEKSMNGQSSMISKLFFGLLRSTVQCLYCKKNSTTFETFNSLTMSLPVSNKCTLDECVRKFVSGQKVSGWNCPNCKVPRDGEKKFDIAKLPHIIVIHLNRFGDSGGWLEKKNTAVDFPLAKFDLRPYLVADEDTINNAQSSCYNLYAISNHYGTMDRGHYTAFCKSSAQNKWYKYDDHTVTEVPQSQVKSQSSSAYLLFYTSISNDILKE